MQTILGLSELDRGDLALAGGKGANLGALIRAGLPVPDGFCVTTPAYLRFVEVNGLQEQIRRITAGLQAENPAALDAASEAIRGQFEAGTVPDEIAAEICEAYARLIPAPAAVAVRSSATAEDLPNLSFAGQQDTYLNVIGEGELVKAVLRCWASLWTARAIGYRIRNAIGHEDIALAVVVQKMVASEASGVLFTANPLTGKRSETVIDATLGLGEALVSGAVEPDHYEVAMDGSGDGRILKKTLGAKAITIQGIAGGGTQTLNTYGAERQALPDAQILALAQLGAKSAAHFGAPQDLEWGWADGQLYVLQSRAITSLFPLPAGAGDEPLEVYFSFASWQGMLDPYSPLGQDVFTNLVVGLGQHFGAKITAREQPIFKEAGMRLFVNITDLIRIPFGRKIATIFIGAIDPPSAGVLESLYDRPQLAYEQGEMSLRTRFNIFKGLLPVIGNVIYDLLWPAGGRKKLAQKIDLFLKNMREAAQKARNLTVLVETIESTAHMGPSMLMPYLVPGVIAGQMPLQVLIALTEGDPENEGLPLEMTRGLPYNVTTEMDLQLWQAACAIRADEASKEHFTQTPAAELSVEYLMGNLPEVAQKEVEAFLAVYGLRGLGEIDFYRERWNENPAHVIQMLKNYLQIDPQSGSPETMFRNGREKAVEARKKLIANFKKRNPIKAWLAGILSERIFELAGLRETPKFAIVRFLGEVRQALLRVGQDMATSGELTAADDLFFLHLWELRQLAEGTLPNARALIAERRQTYTREHGRRRLPRILLSDGTAYFEGVQPAGVLDENTLCGTPVSAGVAEGTVHIILDPHKDHLAPGEILVCPATDPAWTPLFLSAGGLVMEVGGMMTHGSVVAREYGIPAVVGVTAVTTRLKTGQRVRVDGSSGLVMLLDESAG